MNCTAISKLIGYTCHPLNDDGTIAMIDIPFTFADGDDVPAYVELSDGFVRFFDDGEIFDHFEGRGLFHDDDDDTEFLTVIAASNGISFSDAWEIKVDAAPQEAAGAFARYMAAMLAFVRWEKAWEASVGDELRISLVK